MAAIVPAFQALAQCEDQELLASDGQESDFFGECVAIDGEWMAVGADGDELPGEGANTNRGAVYVFRKVGAEWVEWQKLVASDSSVSQKFGDSVAVYGDVIAIGARSTTESAYVFRLRHGKWVEEAKLRPIDGLLGAFGESIAVGPDLVIVGAPLDSVNAFWSGAAHVYAFIGGQWAPQIKLLASDGQKSARFGTSVVIDSTADRLFIGAPRQDLSPGISGAVYIFEPGDVGEPLWKEIVKLKPQDGPSGLFGSSVASDGKRIVVGAWGDGFAGSASGAAFIFEHLGGVWTQAQRLHANDPGVNDAFGNSVAIEGDALVVGAWTDGRFFDFNGEVEDHGSVYLFHKVGASWEQTAKLSGSTTFDSPFANLGVSVGLSNSVAIAGAYRGSIFDGQNFVGSPGKVLVYDARKPVVGDLTGNQIVDSVDLANLLGQWGVCDQAPSIPCNPTPCAADLNADGVVNHADLVKLFANWN